MAASQATLGLDCVACLCKVCEGKTRKFLPNCKHGFDTQSASMLGVLQRQSSCPLCRTPLIETISYWHQHSSRCSRFPRFVSSSHDGSFSGVDGWIRLAHKWTRFLESMATRNYSCTTASSELRKGGISLILTWKMCRRNNGGMWWIGAREGSSPCLHLRRQLERRIENEGRI